MFDGRNVWKHPRAEDHALGGTSDKELYKYSNTKSKWGSSMYASNMVIKCAWLGMD